MGLLDALRGELVDIVEWVDDTSRTLVWRFPRYQNAIKNGALSERALPWATIPTASRFPALRVLPLFLASARTQVAASTNTRFLTPIALT